MFGRKKKKVKTYAFWYVADPTIPRNSEANMANQRTKEFTSFWSMLWFILRDKEAMASVKADRCQFINVMES